MSTVASCSRCRARVDRIQASPNTGRAHLGIAYPCGCWLTPVAAVALIRTARALRDVDQKQQAA